MVSNNKNEIEMAVIKNQMTTLQGDVSEVKVAVKDISGNMQALMISWESARSSFVSIQVHEQNVRELRHELFTMLTTIETNNKKSLDEIESQLNRLNTAYWKIVGAGVTLSIILTQFKAIISFLQN